VDEECEGTEVFSRCVGCFCTLGRPGSAMGLELALAIDGLAAAV